MRGDHSLRNSDCSERRDQQFGLDFDLLTGLRRVVVRSLAADYLPESIPIDVSTVQIAAFFCSQIIPCRAARTTASQ